MPMLNVKFYATRDGKMNIGETSFSVIVMNDHNRKDIAAWIYENETGKRIAYGRYVEVSFINGDNFTFQVFSKAGAILMTCLVEHVETAETIPHFHKEFPDFPIVDMPAIPAHWSDESWHNDSCPSFNNDALGLCVFVDYADVAKREIDDEDMPRFSLSSYEPENRIDYTDIVSSNDWSDIQKAMIAYEFAAVLKSWLTPAEWNKMRANNHANIGLDVCASHDYCDANEAMSEAFTKVTGRAINGDNEADCILWGAAWQFAMITGLTAETFAEREEKAQLGAEYAALIGYDPFEDDASATIESVKQTLAEYKAETAAPLNVNNGTLDAFLQSNFDLNAASAIDDIGGIFGMEFSGKEDWTVKEAREIAERVFRGLGLLPDLAGTVGNPHDDDFTPIANVMESLARELPETVTLEMVTENSDLARIILAADDIGNRVSTATLSTLKSR